MNDIICSFTSLSSRTIYLDKVINSLLKQTIIPDNIVLYYQGNESSLPKDVLDLRNDIFNIVFIDDKYRSYSKFYYALNDFKNYNLILCDDDIEYNDKYIEKLYHGHLIHQNDVICNCYKNLEYKNYLYSTKRVRMQEKYSNYLHFLSGFGTLIPKNMEYSHKLNIDEFYKNVPTHDELYLFTHIAINPNVNVYCPGLYNDNNNFMKEICKSFYIFDNNLSNINNANDFYVERVYFRYITQILKEYNVL